MIALTKTRVICYLAAIFAAGALAGGVGGYSIARKQQPARPHGPPPPKDMVQHTIDRLESRLSLTPEQVGRIRSVVEQSFAKLDTMNRENFTKGKEVFREMNAQIVTHLTPEQKSEFDRMEQERREKMRGWGRPPKAGPSDGKIQSKDATNCPPAERGR